MSATRGDPALQALLLPFSDGDLAWPAGEVLFLRARAGAPLSGLPAPVMTCVQGFKPEADALEGAGFQVHATLDALGEGDAHWPLVLVLPPRQRDEARALFAEALARVRPGGVVVAAMANDAGARSGEADFTRLFGRVASRSKFKCRVFWGHGPGDAVLGRQWRALDAPRPVVGGRFTSRPGVFAWDRVDPASALLAEHLPDDLRGRAADLGAGYGYLSAALLERCPGIASLDVYEAEARALALARVNLAPFASRVALDFQWHDVAAGLPARYDTIVSNPPFHAQTRDARPDIGCAFIAAAAAALEPGGRLWLVANRHLPYESVLDASFGRVRLVAQRDGFKVIEAVRMGGADPGRRGGRR
ncbi:class I SAM-dependent methyltransferase [Luteimonas vadosa]|uniref:Class I SAM-dependent methyltransferase n=1 Tax=Luteimonas vadosa TaxID=1165507 RepID=A0ABP9DUN1_9GAMM